MSFNVIYIIENDEGEEEEAVFPAHKVVCDVCGGFGTVLNQSIAQYAYTEQEFNEAFDDNRHEYFKHGGIYDVKCPRCNGANVVDEIDETACDQHLMKKLAIFRRQQEEKEEYNRICRLERAMGA